MSAASYTNLHSLKLYQVQARKIDLECCTRLTHLHIDAEETFLELALPNGQNVQLQWFYLSRSACWSLIANQAANHFTLRNLACASNLTVLCFAGDLILKGDTWPSRMPALADVTVHGRTLCSALPQQLLLYKQLHSLQLRDLDSSHSPHWFSGMTQLSSLTIHGCNQFTVPLCLLSLCQLRILFMKASSEYSRRHLLALSHGLRSRGIFVSLHAWQCLSFGICIFYHQVFFKNGFKLHEQGCHAQSSNCLGKQEPCQRVRYPEQMFKDKLVCKLESFRKC